MKRLFALGITLCVSVFAVPELEVEVQPGVSWQSRNEFRITPATGTTVNLLDFSPAGAFTARGYVTWNIHPNHALRLLVAPFLATASFTSAQGINFKGTNFPASSSLNAIYKFNSYRLTYFYRFPSSSEWQFRLGFTAKIRDADISLSDGTTTVTDPNVGFVPLLHFGVVWRLDPKWRLEFDFDGLAAPQGRAFDFALFGAYAWDNLDFLAGYRMLEGGAENTRVFTYAWLQTVFVGLRWNMGEVLGRES